MFLLQVAKGRKGACNLKILEKAGREPEYGWNGKEIGKGNLENLLEGIMPGRSENKSTILYVISYVLPSDVLES